MGMSQEDFDIFRAVQAKYVASEKKLDDLMTKAAAMAPVAELQAATLLAQSTIHASNGQSLATERINMAVSDVVAAIDRFTTATDSSSRRMVWLTAALVFVGVVQLVIGVYSALYPNLPQVVPVLPPH